MTPLAQEILSQLCLPKAKREFRDNAGLLPMMEDIHCFEISAVRGDVQYLTEEIYKDEKVLMRLRALMFLPAPKTWIEYAVGSGRIGCLLISNENGKCEIITATADQKSKRERVAFWSFSERMHIDFSFRDFNLPFVASLKAYLEVKDTGLSGNRYDKASIFAALALINSPRVVGRKSHMPHAGLQRALNRAVKPVGRYPLNAWTEITLNVQSPQVAPNSVQTVRLSGRKALHFVRAHVRLVQDRLVLVSAHWRGDAAIGIKQSRYKVQPGRAAA